MVQSSLVVHIGGTHLSYLQVWPGIVQSSLVVHIGFVFVVVVVVVVAVVVVVVRSQSYPLHGGVVVGFLPHWVVVGYGDGGVVGYCLQTTDTRTRKLQ